MATARSSKNDSKYWDSQLYALEYELKDVSKSFPMTSARVKQLSEAIIKVESSVGYSFMREMKNEDSVPDLTTWGKVVAFMKAKPVSVTPIWNTLLKGSGDKELTLQVKEKLDNAYRKHNAIETAKLASTNIIEDVERLFEQITHILQQSPSAKGYASDLAPHLSHMYQLDCTFRRSHEQFENALESIRSENNKQNRKHEKDMEKIQQQLKDQTVNYNKVLKLLQEHSAKKDEQEHKAKKDEQEHDAKKVEQEDARIKEDAQKRLLQQLVGKLREELKNVRIDEEVVRLVNQDLKVQVSQMKGEMSEVKGEMSEVKGEMSEVKGEMSEVIGQNEELKKQNEKIIELLEKRNSGT